MKYKESDKVCLKIYPDTHQMLKEFVVKNRLKSNGAGIRKLLEDSK